jgi:hypothetical protein
MHYCGRCQQMERGEIVIQKKKSSKNREKKKKEIKNS